MTSEEISQELARFVMQLRDEGLRKAKNDHERETYERAFDYVVNRVVQRHATSRGEASIAFAAFGDGFCTGVHRADGTRCDL